MESAAKSAVVTSTKEVGCQLDRVCNNVARLEDLVTSVGSAFAGVLRTEPEAIKDATKEGECSTVHAETLRQYSVQLENLIVDLESILARSEL